MPPAVLLLLFGAANNREPSASASSSRQRVRRIMRRHSHPPHPFVAATAAAAVGVAWKAIQKLLFTRSKKIQFIIFLGIILLLFGLTKTSTFILLFASEDEPQTTQTSSSSWGRRWQHHPHLLRGGGRRHTPLILVHSDSQPFVSIKHKYPFGFVCSLVMLLHVYISYSCIHSFIHSLSRPE
jgi:hypothetical protein